jgi:acyl carrier protein
MTMDERIIRAIFAAIDEVNEHLPRHQQIDKSIQTVLTGDARQVDSLTLISLIAAIEERIEEECGVAINLVDGDVLSHANNPFRSIKATRGTYLKRGGATPLEILLLWARIASR